MEKKLATGITFLANKAIAENIFPGCVIGIIVKNGFQTILPFGYLTYEHPAPPVTPETFMMSRP